MRRSIAKLAAGQDVIVSAIGADRANNPDYGIYRKAAESLVAALRSIEPDAPRLIVVGGAGSLEVSPGVLLVTRTSSGRTSVPQQASRRANVCVIRFTIGY